MPVTVTVSRSNPLPAPIALLLTLAGAGLIVAGFTVVPAIPDFNSTNIIIEVIAWILVVPAWVIFILVMLRRITKREDVTADIPDEIPEPPSKHDAGVVAVVIGNGRPGARSVAGTILELAIRRDLSVNEFGDRIVIQVPDDASGKNDGEDLVLNGLRAQIGPDGDVVGPPVWRERVDWWRAFSADARTRATTAGLIESRIPFIGLMLVMVFTAVGFSLVFFERMPVFVGSILLANGLPHLVARGSGYRLTDNGKRMRATWQAFGRYLHRHGSFTDAGPAGVAVWGHNLAYGAVLGVAEKAARPLTPDVEGFKDESPTEITKVYEL
ncbi:MAG: hypothetical protein WD598_00715 [Acidimicrobiia bacterium]